MAPTLIGDGNKAVLVDPFCMETAVVPFCAHLGRDPAEVGSAEAIGQEWFKPMVARQPQEDVPIDGDHWETTALGLRAAPWAVFSRPCLLGTETVGAHQNWD